MLGPEHTEQLLFLAEADQLALRPAQAESFIREEFRQYRQEMRRLLDENACYSLSQLAVNGQDAAKAGLRGPAIGNALNQLLLRVVKGQLPNDRQALLTALNEMK